MDPLVLYFAVVERGTEDEDKGEVTQRYPVNDHEKFKFPSGLPVFCIPGGFAIEKEPIEPRYFVSELTDEEGKHMFAHILIVYEPCQDQSYLYTYMYLPKAFVLLSKFNSRVFRTCLKYIYESLSKDDLEFEAETTVAGLLEGVHIFGRDESWFNLGDEQLFIRPSTFPTVPDTDDKVAKLFRNIGGINNFVLLIRAILTDQKIIVHSESLSRNSDAVMAIKSLIYPLQYLFPSVSVLPDCLDEITESPMPFVMGVLESTFVEKIKVSDAVFVNLDIGKVTVPTTVDMPEFPQGYSEMLIARLQMVLRPNYLYEDLLVPPTLPLPMDEFTLDKYIRAVVLRTVAELLDGYRLCLQVVRLYPEPVIVFHEAAFMGMRGFKDAFVKRLLGGELFNHFVSLRGPPFRETDIFDRIGDKDYGGCLDMLLSISKLASHLQENEKQTTVAKTSESEAEGSSMLLKDQPPKFALEDTVLRELNHHEIYQQMSEFQEELADVKVPENFSRKQVVLFADRLIHNSRGVLDMQRAGIMDCLIGTILENRISDAKKEWQVTYSWRRAPKNDRQFCVPACRRHRNHKATDLDDELFGLQEKRQPPPPPAPAPGPAAKTDASEGKYTWSIQKIYMMCAVEMMLREPEGRVALCSTLTEVPSSKANLESSQFDLIVRLINCALANDSEHDEYGVAFSCIPICMKFSRRLSHGVSQYAYTCVQDHAVWENIRFWEAAFFQHVQQHLRQLYAKVPADRQPVIESACVDTWGLQFSAYPLTEMGKHMSKEYTSEEIQKMAEIEEGVVYAQGKHFVNLLGFMLIPLDATKLTGINTGELEKKGNIRALRDLPEKIAQLEFEEAVVEEDNMGTSIVQSITEVLDRLLATARLGKAQRDQLIEGIPGFVSVHIETLQQVYAESSKILPPPKPELILPVLSVRERMKVEGVRCLLLPGSMGDVEVSEDNPSFLPAEGGLFLTNYRVIFKGRPVNPWMSEEMVVSAMPLLSIIKQRPWSLQQMKSANLLEGLLTHKLTQNLHGAFQLRSSTFGIMNIAFDEEVSQEQVDDLMKTLSELRHTEHYPHNIIAYTNFAVVTHEKNGGIHSRPLSMLSKPKKPSTMGSLMSQVRNKMASKDRRALTGSMGRDASMPNNKEDYVDLYAAENATRAVKVHTTSDFERLKLTASGVLRLSKANAHYRIVESYPHNVIVPGSSTDDMLGKVSKGFRHGRFPVVSWKNEAGAMLIRGSGLQTFNVIKHIKKQAHKLQVADGVSIDSGSRLTIASKDSADSTATLHSSKDCQELYLLRLAQACPTTGGVDLAEYTAAFKNLQQQTRTGFDGRSETFAVLRQPGNSNGFRTSQTVGKAQVDKVISDEDIPVAIQKMNQKKLFVLVEQGQTKQLKVDYRTEFVPIEFPSVQTMKSIFKKMRKVVQPTDLNHDATGGFFRAFGESGWLQTVSDIISLSTSISTIITTWNSSVALCIEDGWDATCQLMALSQVLMDPYYRTFHGFKEVVEKEWLAFGHRFAYRGCHDDPSQSGDYAPVFILFMDALHQLLSQFPHAFEFNDFYLQFITYHAQSGFFRTFLNDSEADRMQMDCLMSDEHGACIWYYIEDLRKRSTLFTNMDYSPSERVLTPTYSIAALDVWKFYSNDCYLHGNPSDIALADGKKALVHQCYLHGELCDLEMAMGELRGRQADGLTLNQAINLQSQKRTTVFEGSHRSRVLQFEDSFSHLLKVTDLKVPFGHIDEVSWKETWDTVTNLPMESVDDGNKPETQERQRTAVLRLLYYSVLHQTSQTQSSAVHQLQSYSVGVEEPHECAACHLPLNGAAVKTGQRCSECHTIVHEKCIMKIGPCEKVRTLADTKLFLSNENNGTMKNSSSMGAMEGYMSKKGATFRMWTPRYFVLVPAEKKLVYYDNEKDRNEKGFVDLRTITAVTVSHGEERSVIGLVSYDTKIQQFMCDSRHMATLWKEQLNYVIQKLLKEDTLGR